MKKTFFLSIVLLLLAVFPPMASAKIGDFFAQSIFVPQNQIIEGDYLAAGGTIDVASRVRGDVYFVGGTVHVGGPVEGDVLVVGGTVRITGDVQGSVRVAGGTVEISGLVGKSISSAGGNLIIAETAVVGGSAYIAGGNVEMRGKVLKDVKMAGGNIVLAGVVGGDVDAFHFGGREGEFAVLSGAMINGGTSYTSAKEINIQQGATMKGEITYTPLKFEKKERGRAAVAAFSAALWMVWLVAKIIIAVLLVAFARKLPLRVSESMTKQFRKTFLWGALAAFAIPPFALFLAFTIIGIPFSLIVMAGYFVAMFFASVFTGIAVGMLGYRWLKIEYKNPVWPAVFGVIVVQSAVAIPFLGVFAWLFAFWWGLGGMLFLKKEVIKQWQWGSGE